MRLSIIIPVYNAENTIKECLMSVLAQNLEDVQVIVVDDYSTDSSYLICKEMQKDNSSIELYQTEGKGVSAARNTGLRHADGKIIGFCDADDYFEKNAFVRVLREFEADKELDLCCFGLYYVENGKIIAEKKCLKCKTITISKMFEKILCDDNIMGSVWNKFYKRDLLRDIFFNEELSFCEDTHFNALVLTRNRDAKCLLINVALYDYVQTPQSITHDISKMFNYTGELKYNESMHRIEQDCTLNKVEKRCVKRAIFKLSITQYYRTGLEAEEKRKLWNEIKCSIVYFILSIYKFGIKGNIKMLLLC